MASPTAPQTRVLVAEDDAALRRLLEMRLSMDGYEVQSASDGQAALELAESFGPALLVCDVMMPRVSGLAVCRELRGDGRHGALPIVLLTARGRDQDVEAVLRLGGIVFMAKPFNAADLRGAIENLLAAAPTALSA